MTLSADNYHQKWVAKKTPGDQFLLWQKAERQQWHCSVVQRSDVIDSYRSKNNTLLSAYDRKEDGELYWKVYNTMYSTSGGLSLIANVLIYE